MSKIVVRHKGKHGDYELPPSLTDLLDSLECKLEEAGDWYLPMVGVRIRRDYPNLAKAIQSKEPKWWYDINPGIDRWAKQRIKEGLGTAERFWEEQELNTTLGEVEGRQLNTLSEDDRELYLRKVRR